MKRLFASATRLLLSTFAVLALILFASLIGVGGAALFIYHEMGGSFDPAKTSSGKARTEMADADHRTFPRLRPVNATPQRTGNNAPLCPDEFMAIRQASEQPTDKPRYTYVSYDGGRQRAHLKVTTIPTSRSSATPEPPPLQPVADFDATPVAPPVNNGPLLSDPGSRYMVDERTGRVIGIDGTAGVAMEARSSSQTVLPPPVTEARPFAPEVRVAAPVVQNGRPVFDASVPEVPADVAPSKYLPIRKALPVTEEDTDAAASDSVTASAPPVGFDIHSELSDETEVPVQRAQPVALSARLAKQSRMFSVSNADSMFSRN